MTLTNEVLDHFAAILRRDAAEVRDRAIRLALRSPSDGTAHRRVTAEEFVEALDAEGFSVLPKAAELTIITWADAFGDPHVRVGLLDEDTVDDVVNLLRDQYGDNDIKKLRTIRPVTPQLASDFLSEWQNQKEQE